MVACNFPELEQGIAFYSFKLLQNENLKAKARAFPRVLAMNNH